jgi:adenine-specific DNA-methyltransferase
MDTKTKIYDLTDNVKLIIGNSIDNKSITNKVNMIYFDPPFNSNRDYRLSSSSSLGFNDKFTTDDDYEKFITDNINILFDLLTDDGTLYFHISSSCMFIPEKVLRAKFKFVEPIFWKKCRSKNNVKNKLGSTIDIIWKCNKIAKPKFNIVYQEKNEVYLKNSFKNKDNVGNYALGHLVTEKTKKGYIYEIKINDRTYNPSSGWRIKKDELEKLIKENRVHIPVKKTSNLYKKIYLHENPGKPCTDLWDDIHSISQGKEIRKYPTAKPVKLLERLISISTNEGDTVYDPMCGSGTTGEACNNLNRKCILNDINESVVDIVKSRFTKK